MRSQPRDASRAHTAALDPLERDPVTVDAESRQRADDLVDVGAGVDQGRQQHVAGDTRATVEPHGAAAHRGSIRATAHAAPNPLSMPTTVTPLAHDACIASSAVTPSSAAP